MIRAGIPSRGELAALRSANVCPATNLTSTSTAGFTGASNTGPSAPAAGQPSAQPPSHSSGFPGSGVLGSETIKDAARALRPALLVLLIGSILLLGLASTPRLAVAGPRMNEALARHRLVIAGVGAGALIGVVVDFLIG